MFCFLALFCHYRFSFLSCRTDAINILYLWPLAASSNSVLEKFYLSPPESKKVVSEKCTISYTADWISFVICSCLRFDFC